MRLGIVEVTYEICCRCGHVATGGTERAAYLWLLYHLSLARAHAGGRPRLLSTAWAIWRKS
jgi:hypothetical protein